MRRHALVLLALIICGDALAQQPVTVEVRPGALNRVTFNEPFESVVISANAPLSAEPTSMGGSRTLVLQVRQNAEDPFQMIVQLVNGDILELHLRPDGSAPPLAWTQPQRMRRVADDHPARTPIQRPTDTWIRDIFYEIVQGRRPQGFTRIETPAGGRVGSLRAEYIAAFRNDAYLLLVMTLHSDTLQWIAPQDLYAPGVKAVLIDGDRVGVNDAPLAYLLIGAE